MTKCTFCGFDYDLEQAKAACNGCPLARNCGKTKCPNCGFEAPAPPDLGKLFRQWRLKHG